MPVTLTDLVSYKRLVTAGNNELWYEDIDVAGTMIELTAANGQIDTTDMLTLFEGFQKVFVVNGSNLKVADFVNTVLDLGSGNEMTTPPGKGDLLTQTGTSATMLVDFVDSTKRYIYGYVTSGTFNTTGDITQTTQANSNLDAMSPNPITATLDDVTAAPHWYSWTVFPSIGTKTYGSIPNKAYLGCLYNGRCVLAGNPEKPYQWYMTRQFNPWDFAYVANDAQTPVAGGNCDAGELGDIIRALASYKDDFLIFGCATSMWFVMGDPAAGGTIRELDLTTGIFGAKSWCFDGEGNFYFWGTNGIYMTIIPGTPICISEQSLPNLVNDEAADPSTHRITMAYSHKRGGIKIAITKLSDGSHSNYWYDLKTKGFFPESSASNSHGIYSMIYYPANAEDYRDLLIGCKDGYIRQEDDSTKNDDGTAIDSYVTIGPISLGGNPGMEGKIGPIDVTLAGGAANGSETDSDNVDYKVFTADTAAGLIEKLVANSTPAFAGTITGPGRRRGSKQTQSVRGVYAGIRLGTNNATKRWIFECVDIGQKPTGKRK